MKERIWKLIAWLVCRPKVRAWIIRRAKRHPYVHIGEYMYRWWLVPRLPWLPFAIRVHHIKREDLDPYLHDHPFNWRTIILDGWYIEEDAYGRKHLRDQGHTKSMPIGSLHRIDRVPHRGVWTLFIVGRYVYDKYGRPDWGFILGDPPRKVNFRDYKSPNDREAM